MSVSAEWGHHYTGCSCKLGWWLSFVVNSPDYIGYIVLVVVAVVVAVFAVVVVVVVVVVAVVSTGRLVVDSLGM